MFVPTYILIALFTRMMRKRCYMLSVMVITISIPTMVPLTNHIRVQMGIPIYDSFTPIKLLQYKILGFGK